MTKAITNRPSRASTPLGRRSDRAARSGHPPVLRCFRSPKNPPISRKRSSRRTIGSRRASRRPSRNLANDPRWITTDEVVAINPRQVASSNEPHFLLRRDSLESGRAPAAALRLFGGIDRRSGPRDRTASRDRAEPSFSARQQAHGLRRLRGISQSQRLRPRCAGRRRACGDRHHRRSRETFGTGSFSRFYRAVREPVRRALNCNVTSPRTTSQSPPPPAPPHPIAAPICRTHRRRRRRASPALPAR